MKPDFRRWERGRAQEVSKVTLKKRSGRRRPHATWSSSRTRTEDVRGQPTSTCFVSIDCLDSYKNLGSSALLSSTPFYVCRKSRSEGVSSSEGAELASDPGRMPPGSGSRTYYFTYLPFRHFRCRQEKYSPELHGELTILHGAGQPNAHFCCCWCLCLTGITLTGLF